MSQDIIIRSWHYFGCGGEVVNQHGDQLRDPMARRETLELVRTYCTIEKLIVRKRILEMVKSIATTLLDEYPMACLNR